jgi:microcystin-dependent protein
MSDQFVGEIRMFPFNFAPTGWALCNGQILPISQNTALFSLLGTSYGGDGKSTFGLPNLQGRTPRDQGQGPGLNLVDIGEMGGEQVVVVTTAQMASHGHIAHAQSGVGTTRSPSGKIWAEYKGGIPASAYATGKPDLVMSTLAIGHTGGGQAHNNMPPYLTLNFCIALLGVFPPRG